MDKLSIPNKMQSIEEVHKALKEIEMFVNNLSEEELGRLGREAAIFKINKIC